MSIKEPIMSTILVTGARGFIGKALATSLVNMNHWSATGAAGMFRRSFSPSARMLCATLFFTACAAVAAPPDPPPAAVRIHSVTDIGHEFTFYADGRFYGQYIAGDGNQDARNWGTLHKCSFKNANLLVLLSGATPCPFTTNDIAATRNLLEEGGGVLVLGTYGTFRDQKEYQLNALARAYGAEFLKNTAKEPYRATQALDAKGIKQSWPCSLIRLDNPKEWTILITDADGGALMARKPVGKGALLVAARGLFGCRPDFSDPINAEWVKPLLRDVAKNKKVDPGAPVEGQWFDRSEKHGKLTLCYSDYTAHEADTIKSLYDKCMPILEDIFGVPPIEGAMTGLLLLPTGGGGFSSGNNIGLGIWWGDFPKNLYPMIELIGHEGAHSWVLPFGEPFWNEPIATYIGALAARRMGCTKEADNIIYGNIARAKKLDPDMTKYNIAHDTNVPGEVGWGKAMWIWEQMRAEKPDAIARYFKAKRELAKPGVLKQYTPDDCVAVLSVAMERDLFPWFRQHGIMVDKSKATIKMDKVPAAKAVQ